MPVTITLIPDLTIASISDSDDETDSGCRDHNAGNDEDEGH